MSNISTTSDNVIAFPGYRVSPAIVAKQKVTEKILRACEDDLYQTGRSVPRRDALMMFTDRLKQNAEYLEEFCEPSLDPVINSLVMISADIVNWLSE